MRTLEQNRRVQALRCRPASIEHASDEVVTWLLRAILVTEADARIDWDTPLFNQLGLAHLEDGDVSRASRVSTLRKRLTSLERQLRSTGAPRQGVIFENVTRLGALLGLDEAECELVAFAALTAVLPPLSTCLDSNDGLSVRTRTRVIADILGRTSTEVRRAFRDDGSLATLGLLRLGQASGSREWLILREGLDSLLLQEHASSDELLRHFARTSDEPRLSLADFPHIESTVDLVRRALEGALRSHAPGFHVLLYGASGVGKTELARTLAKSLGGPLFEVAVENREEGALDGDARLAAYRVCQRYGQRFPNALVLFDEMEDVFEPNLPAFFLDGPGLTREKGFTNRLLESTPIPTLWCSNRVRDVDPAFLRRFDLPIEVPAPPPAVRRGMLTRHLDGLGVEPRLLERIASTPAVTPADCERAARIAGLVQESGAKDASAVVANVLELRLKARGEAGPAARSEAPPAYDVRYLRVDLDLEALAEGLRRGRRGTLLLHGPSGTGKTAWVRHLADALEVPLVVRYGSDLLDKYVGETEKGLAAMFEAAHQQKALLFLDEADTFLGSRELSSHRWEVSHTNELLVRMEGFAGVFVAATNRLTALDPACLRRFDVKVEFKSLGADQAIGLFDATLRCEGQPVPVADERARVCEALRRCASITPGDFAVVRRRAAILGRPLSADSLLSGLLEECRHKPSDASPMGFATAQAVGSTR